MITLTKIDGSPIIVNADEIEIVETLHDTTITLRGGKKVIVTETSQGIIDKVIEYRQKCFSKIIPLN